MTDHSDLFPIVSLSNIDLEPYELRTGTVNGYCTRIYGIRCKSDRTNPETTKRALARPIFAFTAQAISST